MSLRTIQGILLGVVIGIAVGIGAYTFAYAKGCPSLWVFEEGRKC